MYGIDEFNTNNDGGLDAALADVFIINPLPVSLIKQDNCACLTGQPYMLDSGACGCTSNPSPDCLTGFTKINGICTPNETFDPTNPVTVLNMECGPGYKRVGNNCVQNTSTILNTPGAVNNPLADVEAKVKAFYANNKGLSLAILAGVAYMLLKGK